MAPGPLSCLLLLTAWLYGTVSVAGPHTTFIHYKKKKMLEVDLVVVKFKKASAEPGGISLSTK